MNRILVIRGGAIGDFILTLPALKALRDAYPRSHIEILGYKHIAVLAEIGSTHKPFVQSNTDHSPVFLRRVPSCLQSWQIISPILIWSLAISTIRMKSLKIICA